MDFERVLKSVSIKDWILYLIVMGVILETFSGALLSFLSGFGLQLSMLTSVVILYVSASLGIVGINMLKKSTTNRRQQLWKDEDFIVGLILVGVFIAIVFFIPQIAAFTPGTQAVFSVFPI